MAMGISKVDLISYMSRWHRFAAIRHRDAALKFEAEWRPERGSDGTIHAPGPSLNIHRAEVVGAVIFSVCWMEAVAHELVYIAGRPGNPYGRNMLHPLRKHLKEPRKEKKGSTLPLLKEALKAAGMGVGRSYGDATTLEKVRHTLVHGKPTDTDSCPDEHPDSRPDEHLDSRPDGHPPLSELSGSDQAEKPTTAWIEVETKRQKWKQAPWFTPESGNPVWPDRTLSADLAVWSVRVAEAWLLDMSNSMEVTPWWNLPTSPCP